MTRPNVYLWQVSAIFEVNNFLPRKVQITTKRRVVKSEGRNTLPVKWVFKSKEEPDGFIRLKSINLVKGYMQVPGVDFTESFSPVISDTSTSILIGLNLYHEEEGWITEICDVEAEFLHPNITVEMFIECPEVIVDLGIIIK